MTHQGRSTETKDWKVWLGYVVAGLAAGVVVIWGIWLSGAIDRYEQNRSENPPAVEEAP